MERLMDTRDYRDQGEPKFSHYRLLLMKQISDLEQDLRDEREAYKRIKERVAKLEEFKNRLIGIAIAAGIVGDLLVRLLFHVW